MRIPTHIKPALHWSQFMFIFTHAYKRHRPAPYAAVFSHAENNRPTLDFSKVSGPLSFVKFNSSTTQPASMLIYTHK